MTVLEASILDDFPEWREDLLEVEDDSGALADPVEACAGSD